MLPISTWGVYERDLLRIISVIIVLSQNLLDDEIIARECNLPIPMRGSPDTLCHDLRQTVRVIFIIFTGFVARGRRIVIMMLGLGLLGHKRHALRFVTA